MDNKYIVLEATVELIEGANFKDAVHHLDVALKQILPDVEITSAKQEKNHGVDVVVVHVSSSNVGNTFISLSQLALSAEKTDLHKLVKINDMTFRPIYSTDGKPSSHHERLVAAQTEVIAQQGMLIGRMNAQVQLLTERVGSVIQAHNNLFQKVEGLDDFLNQYIGLDTTLEAFKEELIDLGANEHKLGRVNQNIKTKH